MQFNGTLYPYQSEIISVFEKERIRGDKKIHIVAPPGSGKTIIGLEIMRRIDAPTLILVPNLTLQEQWKDKLEKLFLSSTETIDDLVSTNINEIKKINIITYQSLSGTDTEDIDVHEKILNLWFKSEKDEFNNQEEFLLFVNGLKIENPKEYGDLYGKARKKLKESGESEYTRKLMKGAIHNYVSKLRELGVRTMIVDEAHHLTSWWSHVLHEIWRDLNEPYIIGLTATPPFDDADYFELDESYSELLGTVDYYVPTPAIVKSGRLAPYSDLVYIVPPDENLSNILKAKEKILTDFLELHKDEITLHLHTFLVENFVRLKTNSLDLVEKWMRFVYVNKTPDIDMSSYITGNAIHPLTIEDIAKSIGKWGADGFKKTKKSGILNEIKSIFFDLGYIWRGANLYKFETPIEKGLIYSKSKITGVKIILKKEIKNLGEELRVAIITDFLDVESDWINGHTIFDELSRDFASLNPFLVSGQGIWKIENGIKIETNETILSITEKLSSGETKLVIGTRGILGEGWDCPRLNTLIDLTGVSAYMSVNQVHGRAIRLDIAHPEKVANIYDIVCVGTGYQGLRDFERLKKKHAQFYGVDDSGLVIKELDHIYPQLERIISNSDRINNYTLKKSTLRGMVRELWNIGGDYKNEEIFSLSIEILKPYEALYYSSKIKPHDISILLKEKENGTNLMELGNTKYHAILRRGIQEMTDATLQVLRHFDLIPSDFTYSLNWTNNGSITIVSNYQDVLVSKRFIETIAPIFNTITDQKYILNNKYINTEDGIFLLPSKVKIISNNFIYYGIVSFIVLSILFTLFRYLNIELVGLILLIPLFTSVIGMILGLYSTISENNHDKNKSQQQILENIFMNESNISGLPNIISSNEEKRRWFIGKEYGAIPERANWYNKFSKYILWIPYTLGILIFIIVFSSNNEAFIMLNTTVYIMLTIVFIVGASIYLTHTAYVIYAKIVNYYRRKAVIHLSGTIEPTSQSDIGKPSFLSAKIEKLWI